VQVGTRWRPFRSRFLAMLGDTLVLEYPTPPPGFPPPELTAGEAVGITFVHRRSHMVMTSLVRAREDFRLNASLTTPALVLNVPVTAASIDRRGAYRVDIPNNMPMALRLWAGGQGQRPTDASTLHPQYEACAGDLSVGGLLVNHFSADPCWKGGDYVGLDLLPRYGQQISLNAAVRYRRELAGGTFCYGLQFIGSEPIDLTPANTMAIARLVAEYERYWLRRR
jgi:c-di-GMP-binding flagellar brake protein YcgR